MIKIMRFPIFIFSVFYLTIFLCNIYAFTGQKPASSFPALAYHHILKDDENKYFIKNDYVTALADFEEQMGYLYDNGFHTVTSEELNDFLYNNLPLPPKSVMITFDDGYLSSLYYAYPILKKYNFKAVSFLIGCAMGETTEPFNPDALQYFGKDQLEHTRDVFEFASHTYDMHYIKDKHAAIEILPEKEILADLSKSFCLIDNEQLFSYPYGKYNQKSIDALKGSGIKIAFGIKDGYIYKKSDPYRLNRFLMYNGLPMKRFIKIVNQK